jgi:uncharacterized phage protein (TIGR01671 family)
MREIRFRAWHKILKKMVHIDAIDFTGGTIRQNDPCVVNDQDGGGCYLLDNLVLMQYTGLKDRNGTEVYEGDIIERKRIGLRESIDTAGNVEWTKGEIIDMYEIKYVIDTLDLHDEYAELYNGFIGVHLDNADRYSGIGNEFKFENCGTAGIVTTEYEVVGNIYE